MINHEWHSETIKRFKTLPIESLLFIQKDAREAAELGDQMGNPKAGQYWDEYLYAGQEIKRRQDAAGG